MVKLTVSIAAICTLLYSICLVASADGDVTMGPYGYKHTTYSNPLMDPTNKHIDVLVPTGAPAGTKFPLLVYAHGFSDVAFEDYPKLFPQLVSWGYVLAASLACREGCLDNCKSHFLDPPCYGNYYEEQLKVITWANNQSELPIDYTAGVAVAGHSMGGQSTLFSTAYNASTHNIKAAAMHHAYTHIYPAITDTPFLAFTGTTDPTAPPKMAEDIFNAPGAYDVRGLINKVGANHHEPTTSYNPVLAEATVAWFKLHVDQKPVSMGRNWTDFIYGTGSTTLCGGADGKMAACDIRGA